MDRFQPVTGIWQGACYDHAHGVIEIRFTHLGIDVNVLDVPGIISCLDIGFLLPWSFSL
jgi:hypothetical protein